MTQKKFAAIFPGQGSQALGMLKELAEEQPIIQKIFQQASDVLSYDLWELAQQGPEEKLNQTEYTQPALLAASVAIFHALQANQVLPPLAFMAGHSLGEYSALVCAKALDFQDAVRLVALRGRLMQEACPPGVGAMAAIIGLPDEVVESMCSELSTPEAWVSVVNYNSHGQVVIAGHLPAVQQLIARAKAQKIKLATILPVSVPAHSALMKPAAEKLAEALAELTLVTPAIPVIHNVNVAPENSPSQMKQLLIEQLYHPVRWTQTQEKLTHADVTHFLEIGPGKILTGLAKRTVPTVSCLAINQPSHINDLREIIKDAL